jgi:hypothetical protein
MEYTPDAAMELNKVLKLMQEFPKYGVGAQD